MKQIRNMNCIELEKHFGLKRGDIAQKTSYPDGTIEIETPLNLSNTQKARIEADLGAKIVTT